MGSGMFTIGVLALMLFALVFALVVVAVHALLLGRMPGKWLRRGVRQPRLWGAGVLLIPASGGARSPSLLAVAVGLIALGHVMKSQR